MSQNVKLGIARRQLGTALHLFLYDNDPVSVHCLACGGGEIANGLAELSGETTFSQHALAYHAELKPSELAGLRTRYWNAMKHFRDRRELPRNDDELLTTFDDEENDHALFIGWYDYAQAARSLPIEAQAFQVWYFAKFPDKLVDRELVPQASQLFPHLAVLSRIDQKRSLRREIGRARKRREILFDSRTDRRPLVLPSKAVLLDG
jgi:hypothetical protein